MSYKIVLKERVIQPWGRIHYYVEANMSGRIELLKRIVEKINPDEMIVLDGEIVFVKDRKEIRVRFFTSEVTISIDEDVYIDRQISEIFSPTYNEEEEDERIKWGE